MRALLVKFGMSLFLVALFIPNSGSALTITSLNLEWFGRGGDMHGTPEQEFRHPTIKELLENYLSSTDVFVFQEIVDVTALFSILPGYDCRSYNIQDESHQHITACARPGMIQKESVIDSVRVAWGLRPGFRIDIAYGSSKNQTKKVAIVGLHLKAGLNESLVRVEQIKKLMEGVDPTSPMILVGDFNTFPKEKTGLDKDDNDLMQPWLTQKDFSEVGGSAATYLGFERRTFDRIWSRNVEIVSHAVRGPCLAYGIEPMTRFTLESFYTQFISDHCPVSVEIAD